MPDEGNLDELKRTKLMRVYALLLQQRRQYVSGNQAKDDQSLPTQQTTSKKCIKSIADKMLEAE